MCTRYAILVVARFKEAGRVLSTPLQIWFLRVSNGLDTPPLCILSGEFIQNVSSKPLALPMWTRVQHVHDYVYSSISNL